MRRGAFAYTRTAIRAESAGNQVAQAEQQSDDADDEREDKLSCKDSEWFAGPLQWLTPTKIDSASRLTEPSDRCGSVRSDPECPNQSGVSSRLRCAAGAVWREFHEHALYRGEAD